ncbi:16658_t:CDS:2, partial [Acaulospora morrowiae]
IGNKWEIYQSMLENDYNEGKGGYGYNWSSKILLSSYDLDTYRFDYETSSIQP